MFRRPSPPLRSSSSSSSRPRSPAAVSASSSTASRARLGGAKASVLTETGQIKRCCRALMDIGATPAEFSDHDDLVHDLGELVDCQGTTMWPRRRATDKAIVCPFPVCKAVFERASQLTSHGKDIESCVVALGPGGRTLRRVSAVSWEVSGATTEAGKRVALANGLTTGPFEFVSAALGSGPGFVPFARSGRNSAATLPPSRSSDSHPTIKRAQSAVDLKTVLMHAPPGLLKHSASTSDLTARGIRLPGLPRGRSPLSSDGYGLISVPSSATSTRPSSPYQWMSSSPAGPRADRLSDARPSTSSPSSRVASPHPPVVSPSTSPHLHLHIPPVATSAHGHSPSVLPTIGRHQSHLSTSSAPTTPLHTTTMSTPLSISSSPNWPPPQTSAFPRTLIPLPSLGSSAHQSSDSLSSPSHPYTHAPRLSASSSSSISMFLTGAEGPLGPGFGAQAGTTERRDRFSGGSGAHQSSSSSAAGIAQQQDATSTSRGPPDTPVGSKRGVSDSTKTSPEGGKKKGKTGDQEGEGEEQEEEEDGRQAGEGTGGKR